MNNDIKVQIICVTYNQKDYIKEALDSFLMQKTNFNFEVLVGDDCSTDGTSEIVAEYAQKYPDIIKHIRRSPNMGCLSNFMDLCERITASYAAFCDGDDYWTDENKLQKQYDFMEKNKDVNVCSHLTEIELSYNCVYSNYYKRQKRGLVIPSRLQLGKKLKASDIAEEIPHMSSLFVRWTVKRFPEWCKRDGKCGDQPILFLQMGQGSFYAFKEKMSVYRKADTGVFSNKESQDLHFIETRPEYFKLLSGFIQYYRKNYPKASVKGFEKRLMLEIINYMNAVINTESWDEFSKIKEKYPKVYYKIKNLLTEYNSYYNQVEKLGLKKAYLLRKSSVLVIIKPIMNVIYRSRKLLRILMNIIRNIHSFFSYWLFSLVPKKKNLWVITGFKSKNYMDNTKYLYEYIVNNHPEIEMVWLTKSKEVRKKLKEAKMPVHFVHSPIGVWTMARANVAFSDHFRMSDYDNRFGFNARTKFVNIFHGFGPKGMKPIGDKIPNTNVDGVRLSSDIIISSNDNILIKVVKLIKWFFISPFRELFENYYGIVCPGPNFIKYFAIPWKTPKEAFIFAGYPRHVDLYNTNLVAKKKIIYAPTYRWDNDNEEYMISKFLDFIPVLNKLLEEKNMEFVLRLHPHTWRDYESVIKSVIQKYPRFSISEEKDIYKTINEYALLLTDYSSIGWEFLITGAPTLFIAHDYITYQETDCPFDMDYQAICGNEIFTSWNDVIFEMKKIIDDPQIKTDKQKNILKDFYPIEYNDENNSKRIVETIKVRTGLNK